MDQDALATLQARRGLGWPSLRQPPEESVSIPRNQ
jgi:hypothetical protein